MLPPPCFTVGMVPGFLQMWSLAFRPKSVMLDSSDQRILFLMVWESFRCLLANSKRAVMCLLLRSGFRLATTIKAWLAECCRDVCPSGRFSHLHRGTLELCQSDHRILGYLPDQWLSPPITQFGRRPALGRFLVVPNIFHIRIMEATVFLVTFNAAEMFWYPFPDLCLETILSRSSKDNYFGLMAWFMLWHALTSWDII